MAVVGNGFYFSLFSLFSSGTYVLIQVSAGLLALRLVSKHRFIASFRVVALGDLVLCRGTHLTVTDTLLVLKNFKSYFFN